LIHTKKPAILIITSNVNQLSKAVIWKLSDLLFFTAASTKSDQRSQTSAANGAATLRTQPNFSFAP